MPANRVKSRVRLDSPKILEAARRGAVQGSQGAIDAALPESLQVVGKQSGAVVHFQIIEAQTEKAGLCVKLFRLFRLQVSQCLNRLDKFGRCFLAESIRIRVLSRRTASPGGRERMAASGPIANGPSRHSSIFSCNRTTSWRSKPGQFSSLPRLRRASIRSTARW